VDCGSSWIVALPGLWLWTTVFFAITRAPCQQLAYNVGINAAFGAPPKNNDSYILPGPDYFDEEAKCYSRLFEFCQVTFCHSSGVA